MPELILVSRAVDLLTLLHSPLHLSHFDLDKQATTRERLSNLFVLSKGELTRFFEGSKS